jgi:hypothetical protein
MTGYSGGGKGGVKGDYHPGATNHNTVHLEIKIIF